MAEKTIKTTPKYLEYERDYRRYSIGFFVILLGVILAYLMTVQQWLSGDTLAIVLLLLASLMLIVHLTVFLHLGKSEKGPKLMTYSTLYMFAIVLIMVGCSIWIMYHMNINMGMTPEQMNQYMLDQNSKGF